MNRDKLLGVLNRLNFPTGEYVVFGGSVLVIRGIRTGDDIDVFVSRKLYKELRDQHGWHEQWPTPGDPPLLEAIVDGIAVHAFYDWEKRDKWQPDVAHLIKTAEIINGYAFVSLEDMYGWKSLGRRLKDRQDIRLIESYWQEALA